MTTVLGTRLSSVDRCYHERKKKATDAFEEVVAIKKELEKVVAKKEALTAERDALLVERDALTQDLVVEQVLRVAAQAKVDAFWK